MARVFVLTFAVVLLGLFVLGETLGSEWGYGLYNGPDTWTQDYTTCAGVIQSPIDIYRTEYAPWNDVLRFRGYDREQGKMDLYNSGHTALVEMQKGRWTVAGGSLGRETFKLLQLHFHWGADSERGSEHTINSKQYPLEMHMVHINTRYPADSDDPYYNSDGFTVFAVMFKVSDEDNPAFEEITEALHDIKYNGQSTILWPFRLRWLMPDNLEDYYSYQGSFTTPACSEVVTWIIFRQTVTISEKQLEAFRRLRTFEEEGEPEEGDTGAISDNFRPVQSLNGRSVTRSFF